MYKYDHIDQKIVNERVNQYQNQLDRYLNKELSDEEFRPLRLQNGLYIQRHAPMLRVAIPYGLLSSNQLFKLADIADKHDRGYGILAPDRISNSIGQSLKIVRIF